MSIEARKASLQRKHAELEEQLQSLVSHPAHDPNEEKQLKREKLRLKDEISRLPG
jgi:hypothetical protein